MTGIHKSELNKFSLSTSDSSIYATADNTLYRFSPQSKPFTQVADTRYPILYIYVYSQDLTTSIYLATADGLFELNRFNHLERIYYASDTLARRCLSVLVSDGLIYLGTARGAYVKSVKKKQWQKLNELPSMDPIYHIREDVDNIYFATDHEVISLDKRSQEFDTIFIKHTHSQTDVPEELSDDSNQPPERPFVKAVQVSRHIADQLYVVTQEGIYMSANHGRAWIQIPSENLPLEETTSLIVSKQYVRETAADSASSVGLILGTQRGAFFYSDGRWTPVYNGMETNRVNDLIMDASSTVFAATDRGLYSLALGQTLPLNFAKESLGSSVSEFEHEPTIGQVYKWAIEYADVNSNKIKSWHKAAGKKAILPSLNVGLDRSDGEVFHWDTGASPDTLIKGRDLVSWDVSLTWNLSDLVWNNDQTSIDSRSKLMVELREDILDQVTRIYFERRRLQYDPASEDDLEINLRVEELTALLDAFTGGEFSKEVDKKQN